MTSETPTPEPAEAASAPQPSAIQIGPNMWSLDLGTGEPAVTFCTPASVTDPSEVLQLWEALFFEETAPASLAPLSRLTFWLAAAEIGVTKAGIRAQIEAMPAGIDKFKALAYLEEAQVYRREDPLLIQLAASEGISELELDALWAWAAQAYP